MGKNWEDNLEATAIVQGAPQWLSGKESACNAGDAGSAAGLGMSPGEGNGNPLPYLSWKIPWTEEPGWI